MQAKCQMAISCREALSIYLFDAMQMDMYVTEGSKKVCSVFYSRHEEPVHLDTVLNSISNLAGIIVPIDIQKNKR